MIVHAKSDPASDHAGLRGIIKLQSLLSQSIDRDGNPKSIGVIPTLFGCFLVIPSLAAIKNFYW